MTGGDMPNRTIGSNKQQTPQNNKLREDAEVRLKQGTAPPTNGWVAGQDALVLLFKLASNPDSAHEALKLLHELQVHQVELDLQHAQLEATELEHARALSRYTGFYEYAPLGYLVLTLQGDIIECNLAGARMFGVEAREAGGHPVKEFLAPASRAALTGLLKSLREGALEAACEAQPAGGGNNTRPLRITARLTPAGEAVLMAICDHP